MALVCASAPFASPMSSFFTERTAEYAILPTLLSYLRQRFGAAVPMYFWATREGNSISQELHASRRFRMLVVFARRPKVLDGQHMFGKINQELFEFADRAHVHGLPCIAAFPAVSDLFELGRAFQTYWFPLAGRPCKTRFSRSLLQDRTSGRSHSTDVNCNIGS